MKEGKLFTGTYKTFAEAVEAFLAEFKGTEKYPKIACVGIAGPNKGGVVKITNANWPEFRISDVEQALQLEHLLILNDFVANGYGVLCMPESFNLVINPGKPVVGGPKVLLGTGTGLGECIVTKAPTEANYTVYPGEGGHVDFAPRDEREFYFMLYVK